MFYIVPAAVSDCDTQFTGFLLKGVQKSGTAVRKDLEGSAPEGGPLADLDDCLLCRLVLDIVDLEEP